MIILFNQAAIGDKYRDLEAIREYRIKLAVWQRAILPKARTYLEKLDLKALAPGQASNGDDSALLAPCTFFHPGQPDEDQRKKEVADAFDMLGRLPEGEGKLFLAKNIVRLVHAFAKAVDCKTVKVDLLVLKPGSGNYHVDSGSYTGAMIFRGDAAALSLPGLPTGAEKNDALYALAPGDFAVFKVADFSNPLQAASASLSGSTNDRLALVMAPSW